MRMPPSAPAVAAGPACVHLHVRLLGVARAERVAAPGLELVHEGGSVHDRARQVAVDDG